MAGTDVGIPVLVVDNTDVLEVWYMIEVPTVWEVKVFVPMG